MKNSEQVIKYNNVKDEKFMLPIVKNDQQREMLIIHQFSKDSKEDYIILGRFLVDEKKIQKQEMIDWLNIIRRLVINYLVNDNHRKSNYDLLLYRLNNHELTKHFEFTQEGYDLITNKFMFTDNLIERTVYIDNYGEKAFDYKYKSFSDENPIFNAFAHYEDNYFFTQNEMNRLTLDPILDYVRYNSEKMKQALSKSKEWYKDLYKQFQKNDLEPEKFLVQMIDAKMELSNKNNKQR